MSQQEAMKLEADLIKEIKRSHSSAQIVDATLKTDQRVIARVTDGIYRQPGSAIRELISNAYDADATRVIIKTDAPRFERITVEDNGHGMKPEVLAHLLLHIGGSAKRSDTGIKLGIVDEADPTLSPGGRKLIGKIGIGLFSVSQLTHKFQITTKVEGDDHRTIATVALKQYSDDETTSDRKEYEAGKVKIWREKAADKDSHGTTITLTDIRPQARDTLRSKEIWSAIEHNEALPDSEEKQEIEPPKYHIGRVDKTGALIQKTKNAYTALPWNEKDSPEDAFKKLVNSVWDEIDVTSPNPQLEKIFDYYLRMVWQLSLAIPLPYVEGHLFDKSLKGWSRAFRLSNKPKEKAEELNLDTKQIRKQLDLQDPVEDQGTFEVFLDNLSLQRPIKFEGLPETNHALKQPIIFFGKCREDFKKLPRELSGGALAFEAYLFWTPKIAPTEHRGSLIRIHGSSGTLFDPNFMRYQVSEQTRLKQITCEIFVHEGLDSALNIDRESFNNAHPHVVFITKWLHSALRQLATAQKKIASEVRQTSRTESQNTTLNKLSKIAQNVWIEESKDPASSPPDVELNDTGKKSEASAEAYAFTRSEIVPNKQNTARKTAAEVVLEGKLKAITQVLASFDLLDRLSKKQQQKLLRAIYEILETSNE